MMNEKLFTNKEIASQVGISEDELFQLARENGLFNEDGSPTEFALKQGLLVQVPTNLNENLNHSMIYHPATSNSDILETKIATLYEEIETKEEELRMIVNDRLNANYAKMRELSDELNIIMHQIILLKELVG